MRSVGQDLARDAELVARRLVRMDRALVARILPLAGDDAEVRLGDGNRDLQDVFAVYEQDDGGGRAANRFLHERGELCTYEERAWILAQRRARFSAWRVTTASRTGAAFLEEVFDGREPAVRVFGPLLRGLVRGDAVLTRLVEYEGITVATAVHGTRLAGEQIEQYVDLVRRALGSARPPSSHDVRARGMAALLVDAWERLADLLAERVADLASCRRR